MIKSRVQRLGFLLGVVLPLILRTRKRPVLFVRQGALGDIICTLPAALQLKKRHPQAAFIYSCEADYACLPPMGGVTTHVMTSHIARESIWSFLFSASYYFTYSPENQAVSSGTIMEDFCRQYGVPLEGGHPRLHIDLTVLSRVKSLLEDRGIRGGPKIVIHPGPSWPVKEWPRESWVSLVQKLRDHGFANIIQTGVGHGHLGALPGIAIPGVLSLVDQLTVEETIALVSLSDFLVGIDSGLMHVAASVRIPAVAILGPTSPQFLYSNANLCSFVVSNVECQGCHHRVPRLHWMTGCPNDVKCMRAIRVQDVLQACIDRLEPAKPGQN